MLATCKLYVFESEKDPGSLVNTLLKSISNVSPTLTGSVQTGPGIIGIMPTTNPEALMAWQVIGAACAGCTTTAKVPKGSNTDAQDLAANLFMTRSWDHDIRICGTGDFDFGPRILMTSIFCGPHQDAT